jgi:hypothetical protein
MKNLLSLLIFASGPAYAASVGTCLDKVILKAAAEIFKDNQNPETTSYFVLESVAIDLSRQQYQVRFEVSSDSFRGFRTFNADVRSANCRFHLTEEKL